MRRRIARVHKKEREISGRESERVGGSEEERKRTNKSEKEKDGSEARRKKRARDSWVGLDGRGRRFRWSECERERRGDEESGIERGTTAKGEKERERVVFFVRSFPALSVAGAGQDGRVHAE